MSNLFNLQIIIFLIICFIPFSYQQQTNVIQELEFQNFQEIVKTVNPVLVMFINEETKTGKKLLSEYNNLKEQIQNQQQKDKNQNQIHFRYVDCQKKLNYSKWCPTFQVLEQPTFIFAESYKLIYKYPNKYTSMNLVMEFITKDYKNNVEPQTMAQYVSNYVQQTQQERKEQILQMQDKKTFFDEQSLVKRLDGAIRYSAQDLENHLILLYKVQCKKSQKLIPIFEDLGNEYMSEQISEIQFAELNCDDKYNNKLCVKFKSNSIHPALVLVRHGNVYFHQGDRNKRQILNFIRDHESSKQIFTIDYVLTGQRLRDEEDYHVKTEL